MSKRMEIGSIRWLKVGKFCYSRYHVILVHPYQKASYRTGLRQAIRQANLSDERRQVIERMINCRPKEFKAALREFMREREVEHLERKVVDIKQKVEDLKYLKTD